MVVPRCLGSCAVAVLLLLGCGRTEIWIPPESLPEPLRCAEDADAPSSAGCAFVAAPGLHLGHLLTEALAVDPGLRDPDGLVVTNPDPTTSLRLQAYEILAYGEVRALGGEMVLPGGGLRVLHLPDSGPRTTTGMHRQGLYRLTGDAPFVASLHTPYRSFLGNDSTLLLPESRWGRRYVVMAFPPHYAQFQGVGEPTYFEIVARDDGTRVRWLAQGASTVGGGGVPAVEAGAWSPELTLDAYEAVLVIAGEAPDGDPHGRDVSGTVIEASAPIQVTSGSRCSAVPVSTARREGCDPLLEALVPVEQWGQTFVVPHSPLRTSEAHHYRVFSGADRVELRSQPPVLPSEPTVLTGMGTYVELVVPHGRSFVLEADGPAQVMGYLQTRDHDVEIGDPAMYPLPAVEQFLDRATVATGVQWDVHYLQVVRSGGNAEVRLDGQPITGWTPLGEYEVAEVLVSEGRHGLDGTAPFGVVQIGWTNSFHESCRPYAPHGTCQTSYAQLGAVGTRWLR